MSKFNKEDIRRLKDAFFVRNGFDNDFDKIATVYGYSENARRKIKTLFNKFVKANLDTGVVSDFLEGNFNSVETVKFYIEYIGKKDRHISARALAEEIGMYDVEDLKYILRGLSARHPEVLNYSDTHDLDKLSIR